MAKITKKEKTQIHYNLRLTEDEANYLMALLNVEVGSVKHGDNLFFGLHRAAGNPSYNPYKASGTVRIVKTGPGS